MTANELGFVRLPPDSTGKKSAAAGRLIIRYTGETTNFFEVGDIVTGFTSGASAEVVGKHTEGFAAGVGELYLDLPSLQGTFQANEALQVGGITHATSAADAELDQVYYQKSVIVDKNNPDRSIRMGRQGDAFVRFDEGSPALSSFGALIAEAPETSRQYVYAYDKRANEFYDVETGAANITYLPAERAIKLDTGGTNAGDKVTRQSHLYHPYQPGTMSKIMQTLAVGDTGKADVRRRWGYFNEEEGLFWELDGTTLYVVIRSSTTGSTVDTRVAQSDWNRDKLDGNVSFNLDISKTNLYWIDFQWLGVGICRFGVYEEDGVKTTCHVFENPNNQTAPYMRQGTLPIRYECENTGTPGSSSELKTVCAVVQNVGTIKRQLNSFGATCPTSTSVAYGEGEKILMAIRPKLTVNSLPNHALTVPNEFHVISDPITSSGLYNLRIRGLCFTQGGTYSSIADSSHTEVNHAATGFLGGTPTSSGVVQYAAPVKGGDDYEHGFENFTPYSQKTLLTSVLSDDTTQPAIALTVEALTPGASGDFFGTFNFDEMVY